MLFHWSRSSKITPICLNMEIATPKPESRSQNKMGWKQVSPADIVHLDDDENNDEDISLLYATPMLRSRGTSSNNAISVDHYSDDRHLRRAIMASLLPQSRRKSNNLDSRRRIIDLSLFPDPVDCDDDDDLQVFDQSPSPSLFKNRKPFRGSSIIEMGQSSNSNSDSSTFTCEICVDTKSHRKWFGIMGCSHSYCSGCVTRYVASKLQDNITQIGCPVSGCPGLLEPEHCRSILPQEVFDRWGSALCEAVIPATEKFYCPYKDCSALLIDDGGGGEVITQSECPYCRRLVCAQCNVPWHLGIQCAEFQKLNKDERGREDIMLMNLASAQKWMRCPKCKYYVEKSQGCLFIRCRCGHCFCYNCGAPMVQHYCTACKH